MSLTTKEKAAYALGISIGSSMVKDGMQDLDLDMIKKGMHASITGSGEINEQEAQAALSTYFNEIQNAKGGENLKKGQAFLAENGKREGVVQLDSGMQYEIITAGDGPKPGASDTVETHYHGTLIDGTVFDSSVQRGESISFPVGGVIAGWTEALQLMGTGSKWKLFIPANLAYGERGSQGAIGPNETLIFEVELLGIK